MDFYNIFDNEKATQHIPTPDRIISASSLVMMGYVSRIDLPHCYLSEILNDILIVDMGASVCITPHRSDFITLT